ncbi:RPA-related protein RADX isoform X2 [Amia ocellicauda]|uniref:RPA-related protein RADX isoform X2 n=1 Tax=Amia ocellicauda TaxID=2972642 RepID=UPI003463F519
MTPLPVDPPPAAGSPLSASLDQLLACAALRHTEDRAGRVAVLAVQRYLSEPTAGVDSHRAPHSYCYDVTVTDGQCRAKCHLAADLSHLVHNNELRTGRELRMTRCSFVYDERRLGQGAVCIEAVELGPDPSELLRTGGDVRLLPLWSRAGAACRSGAPLQFGRKHYLPLWNNEDPYGELWRPHRPPAPVTVEVSKVISVCDLEYYWRSKFRYPPLLVRIMHKARLRFYGKPDKKFDVPYQAYFEVADQTGMMSLVLWNSMCPDWYQRFTVGSVLHLQSYALKQSYQQRTRPRPADPLMPSFTAIEICLNQRDPSAVIHIIPPKDVQPHWKLPDVTYHFITRSELEGFPHNHTCDIIGLVLFVGRCERVRTKGAPDLERFWTYRWVHVVDGTSDQPFILEIFSTSQPDIFDSIHPMTYLVCTQMRVCRNASHTVPYLTSSNETQIFITGHHKGQPYLSDPRVKSFIQWTKTQSDAEVLKKTSIGGHYYFPPSPPVFTQTIRDGTAPIPMIATKELEREIETLHYREHKRLAVQGLITAVQYVSGPGEESGPGHTAGQAPAATTTSPEPVSPSAQSPAHRAQPAGAPETERRSCRSETRGVSLKELDSSGQGGKSGDPSRADVAHKRTRGPHKRVAKRRYLTRAAAQARREAQGGSQIDEDQQEGTSSDSEAEEDRETPEDDAEMPRTGSHSPEGPSLGDVPSSLWESGIWPSLKGQLVEHFRFGPLHRESVPQKFDYEHKDVMMQRNSFHPSQWEPDVFLGEQDGPQYSAVDDEGYYYKVTILGLNHQAAIDAWFVPVMSPQDPRAVGLPTDPHDNRLFSCLTSGLVCSGEQSGFPEPGEILNTAPDLDNMHVICLLDLYRLGGQKVEVFINKVYKMSDAVLV